jgi:uncharacterized iron-regulated membrane protein
MSLRKTVFWLHLIAGCIVGAIVLSMSLSGLILTYERQMIAQAERGPLRANPAPGVHALEAEQLLQAVTKQRGPLPASVTLTLRSDPHEPAEIRAGRESIYVNPYNGSILASPPSSSRTFFDKVTNWHRRLGADAAGKATGRAITGACNLAFLCLIASGAYLWIPRQWSWPAVRAITWFRPRLSGKARDFNWHNVFGVWAFVPLFIVVLGAVPISYPWASDLVYRLTGSPIPEPRQRPGKQDEIPVTTSGLNSLWAQASGRVAAWQSITAPVSTSSRGPIAFTIDWGDGGQPQKRGTLSFDPATGAATKWETLDDANAGRRLRTWLRFVHTGEYYGVIGQTIAGVACAAAVMLVWTGISLALRRLAAWRARRRKRDAVLVSA